ncbi:hypothetical protein AAC387_Pa11g2293 [Persea americana]
MKVWKAKSRLWNAGVRALFPPMPDEAIGEIQIPKISFENEREKARRNAPRDRAHTPVEEERETKESFYPALEEEAKDGFFFLLFAGSGFSQ